MSDTTTHAPTPDHAEPVPLDALAGDDVELAS
jgi:hypothetical protein